MKPSEVLRQADAMLSDETKWTKGAWARDKHGRPPNFNIDFKPVCWCVWGAIQSTSSDSIPGAVEYLNKDAIQYGYESCICANDDKATTFKQVKAALKRAIKAAEKNGE